ncbi:MAG: two-component system LytT family response regulator [Halieaceae bacterium]|jgi:two-component system LytT family response regulator
MSASKINCLIIDDDVFIQNLLSDKLNLYLPEVNILGIANSGTEGIEKIIKHAPELIFLDVEMLDMTGFEMLSKLDTLNFETIFITSYSHYAIKAIRFNALDYLIKPIDLGELKKAITRYKSRTGLQSGAKNVALAIQNLASKDISNQKLILRTQEGELQLNIKDIVRIEGERNYSYIHLINNKKKLVTKTLADLEELLGDKGFFRCHKSHIVNGSHISINPNRLDVTLNNNFKVPISRRKKEDFKLWLATYQNEVH